MPNHRRQKGFTLVEVVVAIGLFSVFLILVATMIGAGARASHTGKLRLRATHLASNMMENVTVLANPTILTYNNVDTANPGSFPAGDVFCMSWGNDITAQIDANAHGTIAVVNGAPSAGRVCITVRILWPTRLGWSNVEMVAVR